MKHEVVHTFDRRFEHGGKKMHAVLNTYSPYYDKRIEDGLEVYSKVDIFIEGDITSVWGNMCFATPVMTQEQADVIFNSVEKETDRYQLK